MNACLRTSLSGFRFFATIAAVLLFVPLASVSQAQSGNTATGIDALFSNTAGSYDTADGYYALYSNLAGIENTAVGYYALCNVIAGSSNTAIGYNALYNNLTDSNTATGANALYSNIAGRLNTASGVNALYYNTSGSYNAANGVNALIYNTTGSYNTANGFGALFSNTLGNDNTAYGAGALYANETGIYNTASGVSALYYNSAGSYNTAMGFVALAYNTTGSYNIALGYGAGQSLTSGNNNIAIGNAGLAADNGVIRIGATGTQQATYIAGINGATASGGVAVYVNANGQLGTLTSSRRFKHDIKTMGSASDKLMQLRPVTFRYIDAAEQGPHAVQFGLIAEEVAKVYPNLVQYDKAGKPFTIYYHLLTPMLLNELQKEHRRNVAQNARITSLTLARNRDKAEVTALKAELAVVKQAQQQQLAALAKLTALVDASHSKAPLQRVTSIQH